MKVSIFTLYNANNVGAFLQAFSLQTFFTNREINVEFVKFPNISQNSNKISKVLKLIKSGNILELNYKYKTSKKYNCIRKKLFISDNDFENKNDFENVIIGSDEIWNLHNEKFKHYVQFFGKNIKSNKIISYAACGNETTYEDLQKKDLNFNSFTNISVRDKNTQKMVYECCGIVPQLVLDPTLLVESTSYMKKENFSVKFKDYILVYSYGLNKKEIQYCKDIAKKYKKKLYSIGTYNEWCDKNIVVDPFEFCSYLENADFVITSTFHGAVLSTKFNKQFIAFPHNSHKVKDFLSLIDLEQVAKYDELDINNIHKIDYLKVNKKIESLRKKSCDFLINSLGGEND